MFDVFGNLIQYETVTAFPVANTVNLALKKRHIEADGAVLFALTNSFVLNPLLFREAFHLEDYAAVTASMVESRRSLSPEPVLSAMETQLVVGRVRKRDDPVFTLIKATDRNDRSIVYLPAVINDISRKKDYIDLCIGSKACRIAWHDLAEANMSEYVYHTFCIPVDTIVSRRMIAARPYLLRRGLRNLCSAVKHSDSRQLNTSYGAWYLQRNLSEWMKYAPRLAEAADILEPSSADLVIPDIWHPADMDAVFRCLKEYVLRWEQNMEIK